MTIFFLRVHVPAERRDCIVRRESEDLSFGAMLELARVWCGGVCWQVSAVRGSVLECANESNAIKDFNCNGNGRGEVYLVRG